MLWSAIYLCFLTSLSGLAPVTPVVPDLLFELWLISIVRFAIVDCVCLFQQADHRLSLGGNLLWPLDSFWLPTAFCVAGSRRLTTLVEASPVSAEPDGCRGLSPPPVSGQGGLRRWRPISKSPEMTAIAGKVLDSKEGGVGGVAK